MAQLELDWDGDPHVKSAWKRVRALMSDVIAQETLGAAAYDLDVKASLIAHAMAGRERHYARAEWLVYCLIKSRNRELIEALADLAGYEVRLRRPPEPAEQLAALMEQLEESLGPDMRRLLLEKANRKVRR